MVDFELFLLFILLSLSGLLLLYFYGLHIKLTYNLCVGHSFLTVLDWWIWGMDAGEGGKIQDNAFWICTTVCNQYIFEKPCLIVTLITKWLNQCHWPPTPRKTLRRFLYLSLFPIFLSEKLQIEITQHDHYYW